MDSLLDSSSVLPTTKHMRTKTTLHPLDVRQKGLSADCHSCLQGYASTTFDDLVARLGRPHYKFNGSNGDGKTLVEWSFTTNCGVCFSVYCWKQREIPMQQHLWNIGGNNPLAVKAFVRKTGIDTVKSSSGIHCLD